MAKEPVWKKNAAGVYMPLWIERGAVGQETIEPAWAEDACETECCPATTGGPNSPYPTCAACLDDIVGIRITLSGFVDYVCCDTVIIGADRRVDGFSSSLNRSFVLTDLLTSSSTSKTFQLMLATPGANSCGGVLVSRSSLILPERNDCSGTVVCTSTNYLVLLQCTVRCVENGVVFSDFAAYYDWCNVSGDARCDSVSTTLDINLFGSNAVSVASICNTYGIAIADKTVASGCSPVMLVDYVFEAVY